MLVAWTLVVYSAAGHKEWRFIHPLLPILHVFAAKSLVDFYAAHAKEDEPKRESHALPVRTRHRAFLLLSLPVSVYVMLLHGRAQVSVIQHLCTRDDIKSLGFLMPCHSTPWQSHLHRRDLEGQLWALGCEPPLRYRTSASSATRVLTRIAGARNLRRTATRHAYSTTRLQRIYASASPAVSTTYFRQRHGPRHPLAKLPSRGRTPGRRISFSLECYSKRTGCRRFSRRKVIGRYVASETAGRRTRSGGEMCGCGSGTKANSRSASPAPECMQQGRDIYAT